MKRFLILVSLCAAPTCALAQAPAGQGITAPQFSPGLVLRYHFDVRATHDGDAAGVVENPQGGRRLSVRFAASMKLEVLEPAAEGAATQVRVTFEQVSVVVEGDTFDPAVAAFERRYRQLEGYWAIFSASGAPGPPALARSLNDPQLEVTAQNWMRLLASRPSSASDAAPGSTWSEEQPVAVAPLKDTVLRTQSTYLRDEPCGGSSERATVSVPSLATEACAVILTRSTIAQAGSRRDPTPDSYRERGLRTTGRWDGNGETLAYVSRRAGWIVSVTETQSEQMDFTVSRSDGEIVVRQRGRVETHSNLLLQSVETRK